MSEFRDNLGNSKSYNNNSNGGKKAKKIVGGVVGGLAVLLVVLNSVTIIPAGHTGVVMTLGKVSDSSMSEGFHVKAPFVQSVEVMSNKIQVYETAASAVSKDLQTVSSTLALNYRLVSSDTSSMYQNVGTDYQTVLIAPVLQECLKSVTAKYTAEQLITERNAVGDAVKADLDGKLNTYGIYIEKFNIVNFDFSTEFNNAIEEKQVAEQKLLKTKTEQEQAIVIANAEAEKKVIAANAEAEAILAEAQARADANKMLEESLSQKVIAYEQIEKWDGVMPKVVGSDSGFILDFNLEDIQDSTSNSTTASSNTTSNTTTTENTAE